MSAPAPCPQHPQPFTAKEMDAVTMESALVVGTGLIGTSAALALKARGVAVHLRDADPAAVRIASSLGAGTVEAPRQSVDLAVVAVPRRW